MKYHMFNTLEKKNVKQIKFAEKGKSVILFWIWILRCVLESFILG